MEAQRQAQTRWIPLPLSVLVLAALLAVGCSANPATGRRQLNLYSEAQEIAMGREADASIAAEFGLVDDAKLQAWVSAIGRELAAKSERPGLPWSFKVVDDPVVNAFALPGGYIYVTRGLLAHLRSEAELAGVIGHEIGHVTAQHSVNQMSRQQLAIGGLMIGSAVSADVARFGGLAQTGLGLLFLKYGREDESQADDLGLRYMVRGGYEPRELAGVFEVLRRVGELAGAGRIPNWLASHPDPGRRQEWAQSKLADGRHPAGEIGAERFLRHTDGLVFDSDPRQGYFDGQSFYHPEMKFQVEIPSGWAAANERSRVVAVNQEKNAQVELRLAAGASAEEAAKSFTAQQGVTFGTTRRRQLNGLPAVETPFSLARENAAAIVGTALFVGYAERVYQLTGIAVEEHAKAQQESINRFLASFSRLRESSRIEVSPQRIRLVELSRPTSFDEFLRRYPSDQSRELLELINGISDATTRLPAGRLLKRIEGSRTGVQRIDPGQG